MGVDITLWHPQKSFKSLVSPCTVMDRFFLNLPRPMALTALSSNHATWPKFFGATGPTAPRVGLEVTVYFARPYDMKAGSLKDRLCACRPTLMLAVPLVWEKSLSPEFVAIPDFFCMNCE